MKKALIPMTILATLAVAGAADAHDGVASGTCNGGVTWDYHNFDKAVVNSITVTIDGVVLYTDPNFKASDQGQIATDKTQPHTWDVAVNAPGTQFDKHPNGSYAACVAASTTTVPATTTTVTSTTVTASTTTVPATTLPDATTTSVVAVDLPPVPTTIALAPPVIIAADASAEPVLPATGGGDTVLIVGGICFVLGLAFLGVRGRRVR